MTNSSVVLLAGLDYKDSSIPTKKRFDYSVVAPGQQIVMVSSSRSTGSMHNSVSRSIFLIAYVSRFCGQFKGHVCSQENRVEAAWEQDI